MLDPYTQEQLMMDKWKPRRYMPSAPRLSKKQKRRFVREVIQGKPPQRTKYGVCPVCRKEVALTRDHIIPRWIYESYPVKQIGFERNLGTKNFQYICSPCNGKKGGKIAVIDETSKEFWTKFRDAINLELDNYGKA